MQNQGLPSVNMMVAGWQQVALTGRQGVPCPSSQLELNAASEDGGKFHLLLFCTTFYQILPESGIFYF